MVCQKEICVHPAISPFAGRLLALRSGVHHCTRARAEFTTAQEVPDTSTQMHSKYIPTYLTMVFVTKEYVFVRLYCPSRQASRTLERSSLHKRYPIDHLKCIPNTFLRPNHGFCQKKIYVFVRLYHPSLQATCTPERSSSLHKNRYGVHHCTK